MMAIVTVTAVMSVTWIGALAYYLCWFKSRKTK
jgi:hypothetical protein